MRKIGLLLTVLLIAAFTLPNSPIRAQNNPKILRIAGTSEPPILIDYFDTGAAFVPMRFFMEPQWAKLLDGTVIPELVDELPSEKNGGVSVNEKGNSVIKFKIADWAVWSDGQPIVVDDFKLVLDVANDGLSNLHASYRFIYGAKVESITAGATNKDVIITMGQPLPDWSAAWIMPLPSHILRTPYEAAVKQGKGMDTMTDYLRAPTVGNGPFVFAEWKPGQFIRFTRNPKYWKTPYFDELIYSIYPDNKTIEQLLVSGETDMTLFTLPFLEGVDFVNKNSDKLTLQSPFEGGRMELDLIQGPQGFAALKDVNVRKAIEMGLDRQTIVKDLYNGQNKVPRSYWDDTPWFNKDTPQVAYDPDGAKALLKQAGWYDGDGDGVVEAHGVKDVPDGTPLVLKAGTYSDSWGSEFQNMLLAIQDGLSKIGIKVNITLYQSSTQIYDRGAYDLYVEGLSTGVDSINQFQLYACDAIPTAKNPNGLNFGQFCNPQIDQLWTKLTSMQVDERQNAANQIQSIMADQVLVVYLANLKSAIILNKGIQGYQWGGFAGNPMISLDTMKRSG